MIIKNVRVVDYCQDGRKDIRIVNGLFDQIVDHLEETDDDCVISGDNYVLMPSFVDLHVHFRDPGFLYKETLETGSKSALRGGYTAVNLMGNTKPIVDSPAIYEDIIRRGSELNMVHIDSVYAVTKGFSGEDMSHLDELPSGVKFLSDDGKGILSNKVMYEALKKAKELGVGIMVHAEDPDLSPIDYRLAEDIITIRDIYLAKQTGARLHMSHVSTVDSLEAVRQGKEKGANVTCEVTPHHFSLWDSNYRVNPPIRTKKDVEAVWEALEDGTVDAIATDHAPHSEEDKKNGSPGLVGLETAFSLAYTNLVKTNRISLQKLSCLMSKNPAQILGLNLGEIKVGKPASFVLVDLEKNWIVDRNQFASKSKNTPFHGEKLYGQVMMTVRDGEIKFRREE